MTTRRQGQFRTNPHDASGFPPHQREREQALHQMRQSPEAFGIARSRWTLALLQEHCSSLRELTSQSGVWRRLKKWQLVYKRARLHLHSPDPDYQEKVTQLSKMLQEARQSPDTLRLLFADEAAVYRQPSITTLWQARGREAEKVTLSHAANTRYRLVGALDAYSGQVLWQGGSKVGVKVLCRWLQQIRAFYGETMRLVLAWDNWPVHRHEKVLATAREQGIELLFLPTYAPWTNPIEKLWRKMKQEVLYLHRQANDWQALKSRIANFLDALSLPNPELLRYVGLDIPQPDINNKLTD